MLTHTDWQNQPATDSIAATSIAKKLGLPKTIVYVLEEESLVNDATGPLALSSEPPWSSTAMRRPPPWLCHLLYRARPGGTVSRACILYRTKRIDRDPRSILESGGPPGTFECPTRHCPSTAERRAH